MSKKPTLIAYSVKERGENQKPVWIKLGGAWPHENGNGFTIQLDALPLNFDGRIVLTEPKQDESKSE